MNIGPEPNDPTACIAAIFDLDMGTNIEGGNEGNPNWVVGDTFLVRPTLHLVLSIPTDIII